MEWTECAKAFVGKISDSVLPLTFRVVLGSRWQARQSLLANFGGAFVGAGSCDKATVTASWKKIKKQNALIPLDWNHVRVLCSVFITFRRFGTTGQLSRSFQNTAWRKPSFPGARYCLNVRI
jgi:hypothetical protein